MKLNIREVIGHLGALCAFGMMFFMAISTGRNPVVAVLAALIVYVFVYFTRLLWIFAGWLALMFYILSLIR